MKLSSWNIYRAECHQHIYVFQHYIFVQSGEVYIENNIGPNTEPCGTPYLILTGSDVTPSITIHCNLSFRYEQNQPSDLSDKPMFDLRRSKRMSWSMVSNAADKSSSTRNTPLPSSIALSRYINQCSFLCYGNIYKQIGLSHIKHGLSYDQLIVLLLLSLEFWIWMANLILVCNFVEFIHQLLTFLSMGLPVQVWMKMGRSLY